MGSPSHPAELREKSASQDVVSGWAFRLSSVFPVQRAKEHFAKQAEGMIENDVGYVYFVKMGTYVKIGHTLDVAARMRTIQTSCPAEIHLMVVVPGSVEVERGFHRRFRQHRAKGEWFSIMGTLATFLKDCGGPVDIPPPIARKNFFDGLLGSEE